MRNLTASICLTIAMLLGSAEFAVTINGYGVGEYISINDYGVGEA